MENERKNFRRGQIWYYVPSVKTHGHLQAGKRPVIIVSNNAANKHSGVLLAIPCTTKVKKDLPTHVNFEVNNVLNCAMAEQAGPVLIDDLKVCFGTLDEDTMEQIDEAIKVAFGLKPVVYMN